MLRNVCHTSNNQTNLSRHDILSWLNGHLCSEINKIDDLCTGAAFCQLFHMLRPKAINLKRVKFTTNIECEYIQNFKLLQLCFQKEKVKKEIPIEKLVKGRCQDNLEFVQWFKKFHDLNYEKGSGYDAKAARENQLFEVGQPKPKGKQLRPGQTALTSINTLMSRKVSNFTIKSEMISGVKGRTIKRDMSRSAAQESQLGATGEVITPPQTQTVAVPPIVRVLQSNLDISDKGSTLAQTLPEHPPPAAPSYKAAANFESHLTENKVVLQAGVSYLPLPPSGKQPKYEGAASHFVTQKFKLEAHVKTTENMDDANLIQAAEDGNLIGTNKTKTMAHGDACKTKPENSEGSKESIVPVDFSDKCIQADEDPKRRIPAPHKPDNDEPLRSKGSLPKNWKYSCWSKCCAEGKIRLVMHANKYEENSRRIIKSLREKINQIIQEETQKAATETADSEESSNRDVASNLRELSEYSDVSSMDFTSHECVCYRPYMIFECQRCFHYIHGRFSEVCETHPTAEFPRDFRQCPHCSAPLHQIKESNLSLEEFKQIEEAKLPDSDDP